MDEFEIIRRHFLPRNTSESVVVGVGDDGAVLRPAADHDLVSVIDTLVAGVHFPSRMDAQDIGYRAVAVNVSDIAAMGARPRWMTLALTLTLESATNSWLDAFARGLFLAAEDYAVELVGGDTTRGAEVVISVQITGELVRGKSMTRLGARPGDGIYVSGTTGDAAHGLSILQQSETNAGLTQAEEYLVHRFIRPSARVALGQEVSAWASAAIDLSDGLFADLGKLLAASGVAGCIEIDKLPLSDALIAVTDRDQAVQCALSGGDDYELCFTAPAGAVGTASSVAGVPVTLIGEVSPGSGLSCTKAGKAMAYHDAGYRHFHDV